MIQNEQSSKNFQQMDSGRLQIIAFYSRVFILILQYLSNILIPDHDADAFLYPKDNSGNTIFDKCIDHLFGGLVRWDAQYFMHVARYGYTYEKTLAFFPLYPLCVRLIAFVMYLLFPLGNLDSILLLIFVALNIITFILTVKLLFRLTVILFNETVAYNVAFLFCFNPASIFFMAPYTECLFSCLSFWSILNCLLLYKKYSNPNYEVRYIDVLYLLPIMLSTLVRSNGVLNIGFFIYTSICIYYKYHSHNSIKLRLMTFIKYVFIVFSLSVVLLLPFVAFQVYCYIKFCTNFETNLPYNIEIDAQKNNYILPGEFSKHNQTWCYSKLPLAYSYVQNHYWNVGFLKYYEVQQIPNFLLAAPILCFVFKYCLEHLKLHFTTKFKDLFTFDRLSKKTKLTDPFHGQHLHVFVIHALFLSVFCTLCIHIQVTTRLLCSATPLFYWSCASYLKSNSLNNFKMFRLDQSLGERFIKLYYISYFVIGTILFSNFLPWT